MSPKTIINALIALGIIAAVLTGVALNWLANTIDASDYDRSVNIQGGF